MLQNCLRCCIYLLFNAVTVCYAYSTYAQNTNKIAVIGPSIPNRDVFFISDVHFHNGDLSFIGAFSFYAYEHFNITNIALERSESWAYLINKYIKEDDSAIFFYKLKPQTVNVLESWRALNKTLPKDKRITTYGVDFERMEFVKVLQLIFRKHEQIKTTALYKYISNINDSLCRLNSLEWDQIAFRKTAYSDARNIFIKEKKVLLPILKDDYIAVANILENPVTEKHFGRRDNDIIIHLSKQLKGERFICCLGGAHTNVYRHFSALRKYIRRNNDDIVIIEEICTNFQRGGKKYQDTTEPTYMTIGPRYITANDSVMKLGLVKYHMQGYYPLVSNTVFSSLIKKKNHGISTYYVFSDLFNE